MTELLEQLIGICGADRVSDKIADRICYTRDCGPSPGGIPGYIVRPLTAEEVAGIVRIAEAHRKPIFIWGRSTTFIGNGIQTGCILMAMDLMNKKGFVPMYVPVLVRDFAMMGTGFYPYGEDQVYRTEKEGLNLIGTAEVPVTSFHGGEIQVDDVLLYKDGRFVIEF